MKINKSVRNIGVIAHVDAGKTTLTERLLFAGGAIRSIGSVDDGTSKSDSMEVERQRGISVRAASVALEWQGVDVRIIDTPGHADFYPEVERVLRVLDGAVLVVSAVEGVQVQTLRVWNALNQLNVPAVIFVNKLDRMGARSGAVVDDIRSMLFRNAVPVQRVEGEGTKLPKIKSLLVDKFAPDPIVESLAEVDEDILNAFLSDRRFPTIEVLRELSRLTAARKIVPIYFGAAAQGLGVPELLDGICQILPPPRGNSDADLSALTFKIESKSALGRISHVRIFNGSIKHGTTVHNCTSGKDEKPTRILKLQPGQGYVPVSGLEAGDIGLLCGLKHTSIGHILGGDDAVPALANQVEPLLTARIVPEVEAGWGELLEALRELEDEEPLLNVEWLEEQREINVRFFGEVQMEIVLGLLLSRFNIRAQFSKPRIIYKETPKKSSKARVELRTHGFADIEIQIEPLPPGSGFQYEHAVRADKVYYKFMKQIPNLLDEARRHGPQGWEVTDFKATLLDGDSRYDMGTTYADFKIVTPQVLGKALKLAGTHLLEPIMTFEINVPEIYRSDIFRDLVKMRAQFTDPAPQHGRLTFSGTVPFVEIFEHTATLYASSHGQGAITTAFAGYRELNASGGR